MAIMKRRKKSRQKALSAIRLIQPIRETQQKVSI
jgi:hypothetical protein